MSIGLYVIGDEILSGHRQDKHIPKIIEMLSHRGLKLSWVKCLPDDEGMIARELRVSFDQNEIAFCCGGIGSTPDDLTRQACARALGVPLVQHSEGAQILEEKFTKMLAQRGERFDLTRPENRQRMQMIYLPPEAKLIPNPVNQVPGFFIQDHYFVPGFPQMAWPMLEWVLETQLSGLKKDLFVLKTLYLYHTLEADLNWALERVLEDWPMVKVHSLPHMKEGFKEGFVEVGLKALPQHQNELDQAYEWMYQALKGIDESTQRGS